MTTFRNRTAWALWIFMAIWMSFLIAMTWVVWRDGPPGGYSVASTAAIGAFFWFGGLGATAWACSFRLLRVDVRDSGAIEIAWRSPYRTERRRVEAVDVPPAVVVDSTDSDGNPYFICRVVLADRVTIDLAEGNDRPTAEAVAARFNAATMQPRRS